MEEKIKNLGLFLAVVVIALLGYYYYQDYSNIGVTIEIQNQEQKNIDEVTTKPKPVSVKKINNSAEELPLLAENGVYLVYYFNNGFSPDVLQIRQGSSVRFINKSDNAMRIFTTNTAEYRFNKLNQAQSVGREGTYDFTFIDKNVWTYFNYANKKHNASILVY